MTLGPDEKEIDRSWTVGDELYKQTERKRRR